MNDYFINISKRNVIPRSDIIALLKTIDGIDNANAFFISQENEEAIRNGSYTQQVFQYDPSGKTMGRIDQQVFGTDPLGD